jgi:hypothetical protein
MIKGWRNDPAWVRLYEERMRQRYDRHLTNLRFKHEMDAMNYKLQCERAHLDMMLRPGVVVEVPVPRQRSFWEFWK